MKRNPNPPKTCTVQGCSNKHAGKGFCVKHLKKFHKYGDPLGKAQRKPPQNCSVEGCSQKYHANGYCSVHAVRLRRYGDPLGKPPERPLKLSGGRRIVGHGEGRYIKKYKTNKYWMILCPCHPNADGKGYIQEHRLVMEVHLCRIIGQDELVYHIDGDGLNNEIGNLELTTREEYAKAKKFWLKSSHLGIGPDRKPYNKGHCKREGCLKQARANGFCHNHNRDIWRLKKRRECMADNIDHPAHYKSGSMEVIEVIEAFGLDFHRGNAVKYILRAGKKTADLKEDIKKAVWYLNRYLEKQG